jgi:hypothetical protein
MIFLCLTIYKCTINQNLMPSTRMTIRFGSTADRVGVTHSVTEIARNTPVRVPPSTERQPE